MKGIRGYLRHLWPALLLASYPALFLYNQNASILSLPSLLIPVSASLGICVVTYSALVLLAGRSPIGASNATLGLLAAFFTYGPVRDVLRELDLVPVPDATLLPGMVLAGLYLAGFLGKLGALSADLLHTGARVMLGLLFAYNALGIVAVELQKVNSADGEAPERFAPPSRDVSRAYPDIYFIILDEFAGPDAARKYWGGRNVDEFEDFLTQHGFHLSSGSRSATLDTRVEVASRLNFTQYEVDLDPQFYFDEIANNRAVQEFGGLGYETVVFNGMGSQLFYPGMTPIRADTTLEYDPGQTSTSAGTFDPFANMVLNLTMLRPFLDVDALYGPSIARHIGEVRFAFDTLGDLRGIPSPKFVYAHIMLPHEPFVFSADGGINEPECHLDWSCYYGNYQYAMTLLEGLVDRIQEKADPGNRPIIVLQSDHGARNIPYMAAGEGVLPSYPEEYAYSILNALYLPGVDYTTLGDDLAPIDTFPLILNIYFGYQLPLH
ncbi:MAG: hypothetical protein WD906_07630 [Anaerolineales bacterium]